MSSVMIDGSAAINRRPVLLSSKRRKDRAPHLSPHPLMPAILLDALR